MHVQAWEHWLRALDGTVLLRAGAIPTREEIAAWYGQLSFSQLTHDASAALMRWPYGIRLACGLALAALGIWLIWLSYQRARRPSQAELVRRIARAAHSETPPQPSTVAAPEATVAATLPPTHGGAPYRATASAHYPLRLQAFLTAEQFQQGHAPWAVPLSHDLLRIGRHQENDIRLEDKTVHRYHALLHRSPDGDFLIRDLSGQAGNGVYVNGSRIEQTQLRAGDLVELGAVRLRFQQQRLS